MIDPVLSIDVSKENSTAALFLSQGNLKDKTFTFKHTHNELSEVLEILNSTEIETGSKAKVVLEATGNYSTPIVSFFETNGFKVISLNPIETHLQKNKAVRKVKTDAVDVVRIANVYYLKGDQLQFRLDDQARNLRTMCRQYDGICEVFSETQLKFRDFVEMVFPMYDGIFSDFCSKTSLNVLYHFPSPNAVLEASRDEIIKALKLANMPKKWYQDKVDMLYNAARESLSVNLSQGPFEESIKDYISILNNLRDNLTRMRNRMVKLARLSPQFELLLSIPGVGEVTAATILSEVGDVLNFPTVKQLVAFSGLDPSVFQSGRFKATKNKISKRGSSHLRKALYQATVAGIRKRKGKPANPVIYEFYSKKLSEGKAPNVAIIAASNKLLRIIYGMLKSRTTFTTS